MKRHLLQLAFTLLLVSTSSAYYQAEQGRWISRDPIEEKGSLNVYCFLENDSINAVDAYGLIPLWDLGQFGRWLGNTPDEAETVSWSTFDSDDSASKYLASGFETSNKSWFENECKNASDGHSEYNSPGLSKYEAQMYNGDHPWISHWQGSAHLSSGGVGLDKDASNCKCKFEFGLDFEAKDSGDFNPGGTFSGPFGITFKDDWFIGLRDHSVLGGDYLMTASTYELRTLEIEPTQ